MIVVTLLYKKGRRRPGDQTSTCPSTYTFTSVITDLLSLLFWSVIVGVYRPL